jgi:L-histidine Nalpha-methyltransferase
MQRAERAASPDPRHCAVCGEAAAGLVLAQPKLPPKLFYDEIGARLFDRITELDAYYLTRTELAIYERYVGAMARAIGPRARIVEFGSGSGIKTRLLLASLADPVSYVPVDIAEAQLHAVAKSLRREFPLIDVRPVAADYTQPWRLPVEAAQARRTVAFFPGSTIGNFEPLEAVNFLRRVHRLVGTGGALLVGADLHKETAELELAYNDPEGVTAAFNLNVLHRLNRDCGADLDTNAFRHEAVYDTEHQRIEMRLVCQRGTSVRLPAGPGYDELHRQFRPGDYIITEYSHKFTLRRFREMAWSAGWKVERAWLDDRRRFSVWLLVA